MNALPSDHARRELALGLQVSIGLLEGRLRSLPKHVERLPYEGDFTTVKAFAIARIVLDVLCDADLIGRKSARKLDATYHGLLRKAQAAAIEWDVRAGPCQQSGWRQVRADIAALRRDLDALKLAMSDSAPAVAGLSINPVTAPIPDRPDRPDRQQDRGDQ